MEDMYQKAGRILDMLRQVELVLAELYRRFSRSFVQDRVFWEDLSRDEESHAAIAEELKTALLKNGFPFELGKASLVALNAHRQGVESQLNRLEKGEIQRQNAFYIARDFERTLIERSFYDLIRSEKPGYKELQARIRRETEIHLQKLENTIKTLFLF
jgi:hypothetical protein